MYCKWFKMFEFGDLVEVKWPTNTYIGIVIEVQKYFIHVQTLDNKILTIKRSDKHLRKLTKDKNDL